MYPKIGGLSNGPILMLWWNRRHLQEDEREHREHDRLDEADKDFKKEKREREKIRHEMEHHREEHFASKHITEETEGEGDGLTDFRNELQDTNERSDAVWLMEWADEEFLAILCDSHRGDTSELDRKDDDK